MPVHAKPHHWAIAIDMDGPAYVFRFNSAMQIVVKTYSPAHSKRFSSPQIAQNYIDRYSGAGYGLHADDCTIVPVTERMMTK